MSATASTLAAPPEAVALRLHPRRTLIPLEFFGILHGVKLDDALDLVDDFKLRPAFNLATSVDGRRKIHLWRGCIEGYEPGRKMPRGKLADIIAGILPPLEGKPVASVTVHGSELTFRFCCCHKRIADLLSAGELCEVGSHNPISQTPRISYASAAKFLESRVICRSS